MSFLQLKNVSKSFSGVKIVDDISLEVQKGEMLVLVGPSGCGKSTLLRLIAGLEEQSSGHIEIDGKSVDGLDPRHRNISMVFQNYALYPHLTVQENMGFALKLMGLSSLEQNHRVNKTAEMLQIGHLLQRKPKELSGGQRQRVALGRALVRETPLILFDEPLSNLDAHLRSQMRYEIKKIHQITGSTMVYVTHDQIEATTMGDRIAILNQGKLVQIDHVQNIYSKPANMFVGTFVGSPEMNMIPGELVGQSPKYMIGIRPEDIIVQDKKTNQAIPITIQVQEFLGTNWLTYAKISDQTVIRILSHQQLQTHGNKEIYIDVGMTKKIHFDKTTQNLVNV